jgi:hypothetical protein
MRVPCSLITTRRVSGAVVIAAIALFITVTLTAAPPAPLQGVRVSPPAEVDDDQWEERKARAREDVEYFEVYYKAKQAESRAAELRVASTASYKADIDRQRQKGYTSTYAVNQAEIQLAEDESALNMRQVELKFADVRLARSRRRLKSIERSSAVDGPEPVLVSEDRLRELETRYELLRSELDQVKRLMKKL